MSEQLPSDSIDPLPLKQGVDSFLAAQEERIINRYDVHGNLLKDYRLEDLTQRPSPEDPDPVRFLNAMNQIPVHEKRREAVDRLKRLMAIIHDEFFAAKEADLWYDPMDDETFVVKSEFSLLQNSDKDLVFGYYQYLIEKTRGKHVLTKEVGSTAVSGALRNRAVLRSTQPIIPQRTSWTIDNS